VNRELSNCSLRVPIVELNGWFKRLMGLMFKLEIHEEVFYLLSPCNSIHTFNMKLAIDVVFLDQNNRVLKLYENVGKNKMIRCKGANKVLEGRVGLVSHYRIDVGKKICW
jgi:uncharacterized membrane protein (UPF0127 family)